MSDHAPFQERQAAARPGWESVAPEQLPTVAVKRRRRRTLLILLTFGLFGGAALSLAPRADREIVSIQNQRGRVLDPRPMAQLGRLDFRPIRMVEHSRGFPFRTWVVEKGPIGVEPATTTRINFKLEGIFFDCLLAAFAGLMIIAFLQPRRR